MRRLTRRMGWLLALLTALTQMPAGAQARKDGASAQAFDALYAEITGPDSLDVSQDASTANLERLRELLPPDDALRDARFRSLHCGSRWNDNEALLAYSREAVSLAEAVGDPVAQGRALLCTTGAVFQLQGPKQALVEMDKAVAVLENAAQPHIFGIALMIRGSLLSEVGEQAKALLDFRRARTAFREAGIDHETDALLRRLAIAYRRIGDWAHAEQYFNESMARMEERRDWQRVTGVLIQLGHLHEESDAPEKARAAFGRAIAMATEHGYDELAGAARLGLATVQLAQGQHDDALASLEQARAGFAKAGTPRHDDMLLLLTGQALAGKGRHREALSIYRQALPLVQRSGNERYLARLHQLLAASEEALGRNAEALASFKRYSELQASLQRKMQLEQNQLLAYEHEARTRALENNRLRAESGAQRQHVATLERARRWQTAALSLGALLIVVLVLAIVLQRRHSRRLRALAMTDSLTGAASRVDIDRSTDRALVRAARSGAPLSVLVLDLDHFKSINDCHGHTAGDAVLRAATAAWQAHLREYDALGRIGGEEFVMVCANAPLATAQAIAERLLQATRSLRLPDIDPELRVTVSIGLAEAQAGDTRDTLFARADDALYRAKALGRDRVES